MNTSEEPPYTDLRHRNPLRSTAPVVRATIVIGTLVAMVASVGAPFKWY